MNACNGGYSCTCSNTGEGKDYILTCDYWGNLDCSGAPTMSTDSKITPSCSEPADWYVRSSLMPSSKEGKHHVVWVEFALPVSVFEEKRSLGVDF